MSRIKFTYRYDELDAIAFLQQNIRNFKQKSNGTYSGLCPFHNEKSSSFFVSTEKKIFKCFGCNEGGTITTLIKKLGGKNYSIPYTKIVDQPAYNKSLHQLRNNILLKILEFSKNNLNSDVLNYLKNRGLNEYDVLRLQIGFAGPGLTNYLLKTFHSSELLLFNFFRSNNQGQIYFMLFNKIIFPIYDNQMKLVAFAGRNMEQKYYINFANDPYFTKSNILFYSNYMKHITTSNEIYLTEGYFDVFSLYKNNKLGLGVMGSNLSENQIDFLKKLNKTRKIISCFDLDEAGMNATLQLSNKVNVHKYCSFDAKDIDEAINKQKKISYLSREKFLKKYMNLFSPTNIIHLKVKEKVNFFQHLVDNFNYEYIEKFEYDKIIIYCSLQLYYEKEILSLNSDRPFDNSITNSYPKIFERSFLLKNKLKKTKNFKKM